MATPSTRVRLFVLALPILAGGFILGRASAGGGAALFSTVLEIVARDAVDSTDVNTLYEQAAGGLVDRLSDPYAALQDGAGFARFSRNSLGNRYGGLGIRIIEFQGGLAAWRIIPGGAAAEAGLRPGDRIVAVGDSATDGWTVDRAANAMTGVPGTRVSLTLERGHPAKRFTQVLTRKTIVPPSVSFTTLLPGRIGYIPLSTFSDHSAGEVARASRELIGAGAKSLVLDLRGNPGGDLDQAISVASLFLSTGKPVVQVRYRRQTETRRAVGAAAVPASVPLAILVDTGSASASEIVAGALQDHDRALVLGTTSFGKGLVQGVYRLDDGWVLRLTTGRWFTPSGRPIQRMSPDSARAMAQRPVFRSTSGRTILGGGGIVPDLRVEAADAAPEEVALARFLSQHAKATNGVLDSLAGTLDGGNGVLFAVTPAWRNRVMEGLSRAGVAIPDSLLKGPSAYFDRLIESRVGLFQMTDSAGFARDLPRDAQLGRAMDLLGRVHSQAELYALADGGNLEG